MAGRRKRAREQLNNGGDTTKTSSSVTYEQSRDQRIKDNKDRMEKLGLFDLSLKLKPHAVARNPRRHSSAAKPPVLDPSASPRRSSRLKTMNPVSYVEYHQPKGKKRESAEDVEIRLREGEKPEIYTEEQERALGDSKAVWTLCVDGYGEDGKRIYDDVNGETCHQCRQKTLGLHTHCGECNMVQGQFCGDCLYMRYGENVMEAKEDPDWICPACRDICNCSLCRKAKGWMPTGMIYRKVLKLGYKSVAHYLIQTRRSELKAEDSHAEEDHPVEEELLESTAQNPELAPDDLEERDKVKLLGNKQKKVSWRL